MSLIVDQKEFDNFIDNVLPDLKDDEVYFISLSCRNKYLTPEQREEFLVTNTEMFGRCIARSKDQLRGYTMRKLEANLQYKTTKNGKSIPREGLVVYININPSSMVKAYFQFQLEMNRQINDAMLATMSGKQPNYSFIRIQDREIMNCIQKSSGTKHYVDIDCDTKDEGVVNYLKNEFECYKGLIFYTIETRGGFHFLLKKDTLGKDLNLGAVVVSADRRVKEIDKTKEVIINSNVMIPVPGTMQSDHLVRIVG